MRILVQRMPITLDYRLTVCDERSGGDATYTTLGWYETRQDIDTAAIATYTTVRMLVTANVSIEDQTGE